MFGFLKRKKRTKRPKKKRKRKRRKKNRKMVPLTRKPIHLLKRNGFPLN